MAPLEYGFHLLGQGFWILLGGEGRILLHTVLPLHWVPSRFRGLVLIFCNIDMQGGSTCKHPAGWGDFFVFV